MRIALIHYAAPPVIGGVETVLYHHANQMSQDGHMVTVLAGRGQGWDDRIPVLIDDRFDSRHPEVLAMKGNLDIGEVPTGFQTFSDGLLISLRQYLHEADIVIVHNAASLHKNLALTDAICNYFKPGSRKRLILWHHDLAWVMPGYRGELHDGWPWDLLRSPWNGAKQVVVSEARRSELADLMDISPETIKVVPAGLDLESFFSLHPSTSGFVRKLRLDKASPLLLAPVRLTRRKNLELAIKTLSYLKKLMPDTMLVITGPAGAHNPSNRVYYSELMELRQTLNLNSSVHLLAESSPEGVTTEEMAEFYRLADCLILPSREEGFGIPILEAGLGRLMVFCSDLPSLRALAGEEAVYFSPDDEPRNIADKIFEHLSQNSSFLLRDRIRKNNSWHGIYKNWIKPLLEEK